MENSTNLHSLLTDILWMADQHHLHIDTLSEESSKMIKMLCALSTSLRIIPETETARQVVEKDMSEEEDCGNQF